MHHRINVSKHCFTTLISAQLIATLHAKTVFAKILTLEQNITDLSAKSLNWYLISRHYCTLLKLKLTPSNILCTDGLKLALMHALMTITVLQF